MAITFLLINSFPNFFFHKKANVKIDSAVPRGGEEKLTHSFVSAWGSTVNFNVLLLIHKLVLIRWSPKEITQHQDY